MTGIHYQEIVTFAIQEAWQQWLYTWTWQPACDEPLPRGGDYADQWLARLWR